MLEPGIDGDAFLDHLAAAIRIRTVSHEERERNDPAAILALHTFLRDTYPLAMQKHCTVEAVNELSLLITWEGSEPELDPLVLMAHMDTVPVEEGTEGAWEVDAFSGELVDGELWGRGALDDKGPLIAIMEAVEHLLRDRFEPRRTVLVALGHDEELSGLGAQSVAELLRERGVSPWFVVDEGGWVLDEIAPLTDEPVALVAIAEKGYLDLELRATGVGGHSSVPPPSTAIGTLAAGLQRLEANPLPPHIEVLEPQISALTPRLSSRLRLLLTNLRFTGPIVARQLVKSPMTAATIRTTTAVTMVSGGITPNVLPQEARAVVNFRLVPGDTVESVTAHVERVVGSDIAVEQYGDYRSEPSDFSSTESGAWDVLSSSIEETFPEAVVSPYVLTGATDSRYFRDLAGDVYGFNGFTADRDLLGRFHATGERIRASDAERAVSFFVRLIRNAQG